MADATIRHFDYSDPTQPSGMWAWVDVQTGRPVGPILLTQDVGEVSGRVTTPSGIGLRNAVVSLTDSLGVARTATTSSFGLYSFGDVPVGVTYTITVSSRRYRFTPRTVNVNGTLTGIDLIGLE